MGGGPGAHRLSKGHRRAARPGPGRGLAGGLHPAIRDQYFRVGHMGAVNASDILATVGAIEQALAQSGYRFEAGAVLGDAMYGPGLGDWEMV